ncbi:DedA family protein [Pseudomonas borbori]
MFDSITGLIEQGGYLGILALMFLENLFPPLPSEVIMPLAGFLAARGELNVVLVIAAGTLGSFVGALPWYFAGAWLGEARSRRLAERFGRWLTLSADDVTQASHWFRKHGGKAVFFGRLVPAIRTLISLPAGIVKMPFTAFALFTLAGSLLWTTALTLAGYVLHAQYDRVAEYLDPVSTLVVVSLALIYLYRLVTLSSGSRPRKAE